MTLKLVAKASGKADEEFQQWMLALLVHACVMLHVSKLMKKFRGMLTCVSALNAQLG